MRSGHERQDASLQCTQQDLAEQFLGFVSLAMVLEELSLVLEPFLLLDRLFCIQTGRKESQNKRRIRSPKTTLNG